MDRSGSLIWASVLRIWMILFVRTIGAQNVTAVFVFGDSYVDTGNNDYIPTGFRANFAPFTLHVPTGRFSNGKLMSDYFVEGLRIKDFLPPYLDPMLQDSDLITGVSFASFGSGLDNLTSEILNAIPFWKQVDYFKEYTRRVVGLMGEERGTIFLNEELFKLNASRIGLINLPPLGCLPATKTLPLFSEIIGQCVKEVNQAASGFNAVLNAIIHELKSGLPGLKIISLDYYALVLDLIANPGKFGIEVTGEPCCVIGDITLALLCNRFTPFTCPDADKNVFFDTAHLTQKAYDIISHIFLGREILQLL